MLFEIPNPSHEIYHTRRVVLAVPMDVQPPCFHPRPPVHRPFPFSSIIVILIMTSPGNILLPFRQLHICVVGHHLNVRQLLTGRPQEWMPRHVLHGQAPSRVDMCHGVQ
ncbi:hypothetical protein H257_14392 [Aphanomyces astaci]|uniref:Uncharacterized protein n=1 Tax=Aphanomyces astaci TaxID=112090 RepID=W4FRE5_APHAT|nr:hypothetical protein H257_14392 [Aphanomyces astaci]ETV70045.1 hypothetical protein H257_14392 [Aphanomyces astaci]|eukprot:XP_009840488.1 hypothetical protein H257_14392 [Aphanomyces astaci]